MSEMVIEAAGVSIAANSVGNSLINYYLSPISHFWNDPSITSIAVNKFDLIFIRKDGLWVKTDAVFDSEDKLIDSIKQIIFNLGQTIDEIKAPIGDGRLLDGSRINAVLSPTAPRGSNMTIRIFPKVRYTLDDLLNKKVLNQEMVEFLKLSILCEDNTFVSGATGSGKTTILNALGNLTPDDVRIGVIEDTSELNITKENCIYLEAPKRSISDDNGKQIVTMETLLVNVLRQELAHLVVGEIRDPMAATALMLALNTGHKGVKSTLHANNDKAAMRRIINMLLSNDSRMPYEAVREEIFENFNLIIQTEHTPKHGKRIIQITEVSDGNLNRLYEWDYIAGEHRRLWSSANPPRLFNQLEKYGTDLPEPLKY